MRRSSRQILIQAALGVSLLAGANTAPAANITWTAGGGANTNFSSTLNWATATIPGASDNSFIQLPGATTVTLDVNPHTFLAWLGAPSGGTVTLNEGGGAARTWTLDTQFNTVEGGTVILNGLDVITNQFDLSNNTVTRMNSGVDVTT